MYYYGGISEEFLKERKKIIPKALHKDFEEFLVAQTKKCIRINKKKDFDVCNLAKKYGWKIKKVPWLETGYWIEEFDENPAKTLEFFAGYYYFQDAASQIPANYLEIQNEDLVLDMCASPGSKATQISDSLENGLLITNEVQKGRLPQLFFNLNKYFSSNSLVWNLDARKIGDYYPNAFDKILLDAPCSGEGSKKDREYFRRWSKNEILKFSFLQKELLSSAFFALKENGILVYSTCTFAPEENEENVDFLLKKFKGQIELKKIESKNFHRGVSGNKKIDAKVLRVFPKRLENGGFFVAKFKKKTADKYAFSEKRINQKNPRFMKRNIHLAFSAFLRKRFGINQQIPRENLLVSNNKEIFYLKSSNKILYKFLRNSLSAGVKIGKIVGENKFSISINFAQNFDGQIGKNIFNLENKDAQKFAKGGDFYLQHKENIKEGQVILKYENIFLGTSLLQKNGKIKNQVPRSRVMR